jgi:gamma-soluble NSF attachment protein
MLLVSALEEGMPEEAIKMYTDACVILEEDNKEQMAFDLYRNIAAIYIKTERWVVLGSREPNIY